MTAKGHILFFSIVYPPDNVSTAHLVRDLAVDLADAGYRITVVTTRPHSRPDDPGSAPGDDRISVIRTWMPMKSQSKRRNALGWLLFLFRALWVGLVRVRKVDLVLAVTPPPGIGRIGSVVAWRHRARLIYNVKELYPDIAQALGTLDQPLLMKAVRRVENTSYRKADAVTAITDGYVERISERVPSARVLMIPDCVDLATEPGNASEFAEEFGLHAPTVVTYAGNLGAPQNLDLFLDVADRLRHRDDIQFLLVGDGTERSRLERRVEEEALHNVVIAPHQPFTRMPHIHAASTLMFMSLAPSLTPVMPSKAYHALGAARPILAAVPASAVLARLVEESGGGIVVSDDDPEAIANAIEAAAIDPAKLDEMGRSGRAHIATAYSREVVSRRYAELIESVLA